MNPADLGRKYDKIAAWWREQHENSEYGVGQFERALEFRTGGGHALDVGCGAGGRFVRILKNYGYDVTGIDVSAEMVKLAAAGHPEETFLHADICDWEADRKFDFIVAWDSIFHLPLEQQEPVVRKLCAALGEGGVLIYTFGNDVGEHTDEWCDDTFYYSSIGIDENVRVLMDCGLTILHFELDQYPEKHVYVIASKS